MKLRQFPIFGEYSQIDFAEDVNTPSVSFRVFGNGTQINQDNFLNQQLAVPSKRTLLKKTEYA
jgi:hypothetical protein